MGMKIIRQKLHGYIDKIEDKKAQAIYTLLEDEIEQSGLEYSEEFKAELDKRQEYYQSGGKMITAVESEEQINSILRKNKRR